MQIKRASDSKVIDAYLESMYSFDKKRKDREFFEKMAKLTSSTISSARTALQGAKIGDLTGDSAKAMIKMLGATDIRHAETLFEEMGRNVNRVMPPAGTDCNVRCGMAIVGEMQKTLKGPSGAPATAGESVDFLIAVVGQSGDVATARRMISEMAGTPGIAPSGATNIEELGRTWRVIDDTPTPTPRPRETPPDDAPPTPGRDTPTPGRDTPTPRPGSGEATATLDAAAVTRMSKDLSRRLSDDAAGVIADVEALAAKNAQDAANVLKKLPDSETRQIMDGLSAEARVKILAKSDVISGATILQRLNPASREFLIYRMISAGYKSKALRLLAVAGGGAAALGYFWPDGEDGGEGAGEEDGGEGFTDNHPPDHPKVTEAEEAADAGDWQTVNQLLAEAEESGDTKLLKAMLRKLQRVVYNKDYTVRLNPPYNFGGLGLIRYVFVNSSKADNAGAVSVAREALDTRRGADMLIYESAELDSSILGQKSQYISFEEFAKAVPDAQVALNEGFELLLDHGVGSGLGGAWRAGRITRDKKIKGRPGAGVRGRGQERLTNKERRRQRRRIRDISSLASEELDLLFKNSEILKETNMNRKERFDSIRSIATKVANSTNNDTNYDNSRLSKKADDVSRSYTKDAVKDLNHSDQYLRSYFTGLGRLYDEKAETPKGDYKNLYNVHDETGADLISAAHPKSIVLLDSIGRGGLVENGLEQQRQTQEVALSAPTGNYRANYAWLRDSLKKTS
jgi:hypothetical protein